MSACQVDVNDDVASDEAQVATAKKDVPVGRDIEILQRLVPELTSLTPSERLALVNYLYSRFIGMPPGFMSRSLF